MKEPGPSPLRPLMLRLMNTMWRSIVDRDEFQADIVQASDGLPIILWCGIRGIQALLDCVLACVAGDDVQCLVLYVALSLSYRIKGRYLLSVRHHHHQGRWKSWLLLRLGLRLINAKTWILCFKVCLQWSWSGIDETNATYCKLRDGWRYQGSWSNIFTLFFMRSLEL